MLNEDLIILPKAAQWIGELTGRAPHIATIHRWATRGVRGVILGTVAVGHIRYTSIPAIRRFLEAKPQEPPKVTTVTVTPGRSHKASHHSRSVEELGRRLFKKGKRGLRQPAMQ